MRLASCPFADGLARNAGVLSRGGTGSAHGGTPVRRIAAQGRGVDGGSDGSLVQMSRPPECECPGARRRGSPDASGLPGARRHRDPLAHPARCPAAGCRSTQRPGSIRRLPRWGRALRRRHPRRGRPRLRSRRRIRRWRHRAAGGWRSLPHRRSTARRPSLPRRSFPRRFVSRRPSICQALRAAADHHHWARRARGRQGPGRLRHAALRSLRARGGQRQGHRAGVGYVEALDRARHVEACQHITILPRQAAQAFIL